MPLSSPSSLDLRGQCVAVVGLGQSGVAAARLAARQGARVVGLDTRERAALPKEVDDLDIELRLGPHDAERFRGVTQVIVSPGVPPLPIFDELSRGSVTGQPVPVIGELEFACRSVRAPIVAVGGTNGKSTTTTLVARMLEAAGPTFSGGNLGLPAACAVDAAWQYVVLEVSSFQMERAPLFRPHVSLLLNITEDHLDRYPDFASYAHAKGNAFVNQLPADFAIVPTDDPGCLEQAGRGRGRIVTFGGTGDYALTDDLVVEQASGEGLALDTVPLFGRHNWSNLAAAIAAVRALGVPWETLRTGLERFVPLAHRMQRVRALDGVTYYDDSKGTNVGASVTAVRGLVEARCVLIAGGRDKQGSYAPLMAALRDKGRALVVLGEARDKIASAARGILPVLHATDMADAVALARSQAQPGDAVLLSPACSSFDMFSGYAERGDVFARAVQALAES